MLLALFGNGHLTLRFIPCDFDTPLKNLIAIVIGAIVSTLLLFFFLVVGALSNYFVIASFLTGLGYSAYLYSKNPFQPFRHQLHYLDPERFKLLRILMIAAISISAAIIFISKTASPILHGDAERYHIALPLHFLEAGRILRFPEILNWGVYLAFDISHALIPQVLLFDDYPDMALLAIKSYNASFSLLLFPVTYFLARSMGLNRSFSLLVCLSLFTIGSTYRIGLGKNDIPSAVIALLACTSLLQAYKRESRHSIYISFVLAGYASAAKLTVAFPVLLFFIGATALYYRTRALNNIRELARSALAFMLPLTPWLGYSFWSRGNPIYPIGTSFSDFTQSLWDERNSNGLELDFLSYISNVWRLLLDTYPVSGNDSIGALALAGIFICVFIVAIKACLLKITFKDTLCIAAVAFLIIFSIDRFEGRFLTRYILLSVIICLVYAFGLVERAKPRASKTTLIVLATTLFAFSFYNVGYPQLSRAYSEIGSGFYGSIFSQKCGPTCSLREVLSKRGGISAYKRALDLAQNGPVIINDGDNIFLKDQFINIHPLHNTKILNENTSTSDLDHFAEEREACVALVKKGISGMPPIYLEWFNSSWSYITTEAGLHLYIHNTCQSIHLKN